ncbi:hypothetical protein NIES2101_08480 [Calothrix sp. HK-06]|nr:hypothetical protein NIES2101_08480 [Calothrix sp. HK-06]
MKTYSKLVIYLLGTLAWNLLSTPAEASVVCKSGTIVNHANGQLDNCILAKNLTVQVVVNNVTATVPCKANDYVTFTGKGMFQNCRLSEKIQILYGNSAGTCEKEMMVHISKDANDKQYLSCRY